MVKAKAAVAEQRRDDENRWLCTVVKGCDDVATLQSSYDCDGCDLQVAEVDARIATKRRAHQEHSDALDTLRARLQRDGHEPSVADTAIAALAQSELRSLGESLEQLEAARTQLIGPHDHPVFACAKHARKLTVS